MVKAVFTNGTQSVSATLYFNQEGAMVNFISPDRFDVNEQKQFPFSTPVHSWQLIGGHTLFATGDAVWHYPDGEFIYGKIVLKEIAYNVLP